MKVKTSELTGMQLDAAVAVCTPGVSVYLHEFTVPEGFPALAPVWAIRWQETGTWTELADLAASSDWAVGGPIIEREQINLDQFKGYPCRAHLGTHVQYEHAMFAPEGQPLVAAMRCFVASKLGDEVEIPEGLT